MVLKTTMVGGVVETGPKSMSTLFEKSDGNRSVNPANRSESSPEAPGRRTGRVPTPGTAKNRTSIDKLWIIDELKEIRTKFLL